MALPRQSLVSLISLGFGFLLRAVASDNRPLVEGHIDDHPSSAAHILRHQHISLLKGALLGSLCGQISNGGLGVVGTSGPNARLSLMPQQRETVVYPHQARAAACAQTSARVVSSSLRPSTQGARACAPNDYWRGVVVAFSHFQAGAAFNWSFVAFTVITSRLLESLANLSPL